MTAYFCGRCGFVRVKTKPSWCALCRDACHVKTAAGQVYYAVKMQERRQAEQSFNAMMARYQK